jgi:hypothetical protein
MKTALEIVAFANRNEIEGTVALLETALAALDRSGNHLCAALVDLALSRLIEGDIGDQAQPLVLHS